MEEAHSQQFSELSKDILRKLFKEIAENQILTEDELSEIKKAFGIRYSGPIVLDIENILSKISKEKVIENIELIKSNVDKCKSLFNVWL